MIGRLSAAARGSRNVASEGGPKQALARMPRSENKGIGKQAKSSPAGYNAGKSAYIQNNKGGYQARARQRPNAPGVGESFAPRDAMPRVRMSDYRRPDHSRVIPG